MYTPLTTRGEEYRKIGYWFATGWWYAQPRDQFVPDRSQEFAEFCARLADEYALEKTHYLSSVLGMWDQFHTWAPPAITRCDHCGQPVMPNNQLQTLEGYHWKHVSLERNQPIGFWSCLGVAAMATVDGHQELTFDQCEAAGLDATMRSM